MRAPAAPGRCHHITRTVIGRQERAQARREASSATTFAAGTRYMVAVMRRPRRQPSPGRNLWLGHRNSYTVASGVWLLRECDPLKARRLIESASYDPEQLKALQKAFDDAWVRIAPGARTYPSAIEASRLKLAQVVLSLAKNGTLDPQQLADAAVQLMEAPPQKLRP